MLDLEDRTSPNLEKPEGRKKPATSTETKPSYSSSKKDGSPTKAVDDSNLKTLEEDSSTSYYKAKGEDNGKESRRIRSKVNLKGKISGLGKKKWLLALGGAGGLGVFVVIILIFIILSSTKLIQLAEHISALRLVRVTSDFTQSGDEILDQTVAVDSSSNSVFEKLATQFSEVKDSTWGSMWEKINSFRPDKIVSNLETAQDLNFIYESKNILGTPITRNVLVGIDVKGTTIPYDKPSLWDSYVHPVQGFQDTVTFSQDLFNAVSEALDGSNLIIRSSVAKTIADELGIKYYWWNPATYNGKSQAAADAQEEADTVETVNEGIVPAASVVPSVESGEQEASDALTDCETSTTCLTTAVDDGGTLPSSVLDPVSNILSNDAAKTIIGTLNPLYAAAVPACLIYDGSYNSTGTQQVIDNNNIQLQRTGYAVETAADQQEEGNTNGEAAGAMNWKIGDIGSSIPELVSSGSPVDTSDTNLSPQTPADESYDNVDNIFSALFPGPLATFANDLASKTCKYITNLAVAGTLAGVNIIVSIASGFTAGTAEQSIAKYLIHEFSDLASEQFTIDEAKSLGINLVEIEGLTIYAQHIVAEKSGIANSGLATSTAFDNSADAGMDLNANEMEQHYYARPLTYAETAGANQNAEQYNFQLAKNESVYQRFFALDNVNSLLSRIETMAVTHLNLSGFYSLLELPGKVFNGSVLTSFLNNFGSKAFAASSVDTTDYGIVQWGWSPDEEALKAEPTYQPLENEQILTQATINSQPAETYIYDHYDLCWTDSMGQLLTTGSPNGSAAIQRDANGDVIYDSGQCSPQNLGPDNPICGDLVFRYRLEKNYQLTIDQLLSVQSPTTT